MNIIDKKLFYIIIVYSLLTAQQVDHIELPMDISETTFNASIPKPSEVFNHHVGEQHSRTDQIIDYFYAVANKSNRVVVEDHGATHEGRRLIHAIITSVENQNNLDEILKNNRNLFLNPNKVSKKTIKKMPVVAYFGYSIHGDEASGSEAAMLLLYHLSAGSSIGIRNYLNNIVLIIDPMLNPDGRDRFVNWVNGNRGHVPTLDINDREHNQPWPRGRTNHYLFDLNRDWLPATQPESKARLGLYYKWRPQIVVDFHEMGRNRTYFFQPGIPSRNNPNTPKNVIYLTNQLAEYHAEALNNIGSLYYSKESYDDFYYGKGSTFPDITGAVGILFEQASSRALKTTTTSGELSYAFTIKNHFITSLGTLEGLWKMKDKFLTHQRNFYRDASKASIQFSTKAYLINTEYKKTNVRFLLDNLSYHQIKVYSLKKSYAANNIKFDPGKAVLIPVDQPQSRLIKSIMEKVTDFNDSLFYDVSSWSLPLSAGVEYIELKQNPSAIIGEELPDNFFTSGQKIGGRATYAYIMEWGDYYAPRALYKILDSGISPLMAMKPFSITINGEKEEFEKGSIIVPLVQRDNHSNVTKDDVHNIIRKIAAEEFINIYAVNTGLSNYGPDLGGLHRVINIPKVAILSGKGTSAYSVGQVWHLLNEKMHIPLSLINTDNLNRTLLDNYNVLIMSDGNFSQIDSNNVKSIKSWINRGGCFISTGTGSEWAINNKIINETIKETKKDTLDIAYENVQAKKGAQRIGGAIFQIKLDNTHPIAYGYQSTLPVFRNNEIFYELSTADAANIGRYTTKPLMSGYISDEMNKEIKNSASIIARNVGGGSVILFADNPHFRAFWFGTEGLFLNAILFGKAF
ncbi:MAG: M14 family metallopeptidase [Candidatus Neomarinimicrobiota bacterium]|nr:M14 family metallopeptidase [Candidatus Neomarinimicrobiota bacterium]